MSSDEEDSSSSIKNVKLDATVEEVIDLTGDDEEQGPSTSVQKNEDDADLTGDDEEEGPSTSMQKNEVAGDAASGDNELQPALPVSTDTDAVNKRTSVAVNKHTSVSIAVSTEKIECCDKYCDAFPSEDVEFLVRQVLRGAWQPNVF